MYWLKAVAIDVAALAAFLAAQELGHEHLLNASLFVLWFLAVLTLISALAFKQMPPKADPNDARYRRFHGKTWRAYDFLSDVALIIAAAAYGHFWLAAVMASGKFLFKAQLYAWIDGRPS